ncbi:MAG: FAD-dependent oxidoreductase [Myxococcota bacterium]|jgi:malate dehydrogenase (quinone)|nr:malate:quinone oxidoreductase [Deltaproteobacteria bacterium]MCP4241630.1 FAD-dependent oxidoreductase [bacterium]MDP6075415.1 FAD-dependent oxidoreductase [Myxococcota bacterium]MBT39646.1 malate:quinone oxidoreductase [Deltaproteobacteria bacterium]MDP7075629.1 FAD-dependent oxidoreductase [Myxococcota bacterium]
MSQKRFDVLIVGGGISGGSLLYLLSTFSDISSLCLIEKYDHLDPLNSNAHNNSQTLHCGDIETNYSTEKAAHVHEAAELTRIYCETVSGDPTLMRRYGKMLLGVGAEEAALVRKRGETFSTLFPTLETVEAERIAELEPKLALVGGKPRPEEIAALFNPEGFAVDFGRLTESFVAKATEAPGKTVSIRLSSPAGTITRDGDGFSVETPDGPILASMVVVSAGAHSLLIAQKLGYGLDYSVMPVTGSFYFAPSVLQHKVYTVQNDKLPFAAIHGDPDLTNSDKTRFGPTALVLPVLERHNIKTAWGFLESFNFDEEVAVVLWDLMKDKDIHDFVFRNVGYEIPVYGRQSFAKAVQKIVPSLGAEDLEFAEGYTGIRPQLIDKKARQLLMGAAKIDQNDRIIFNMTPSPGATSALDNAREDMLSIAKQIGARIDEAAFEETFHQHALKDLPDTTDVGHQ